MEKNKPIISRFMNSLNTLQQPEQPTIKDVEKTETAGNPVRQQYRQTILNGLKGESYV